MDALFVCVCWCRYSSCCLDVCRVSITAVCQRVSQCLCWFWSGCLFLSVVDRWRPTDTPLQSLIFQLVPPFFLHVCAAQPFSVSLAASRVGSASWHHFLFSSSLSSSASSHYSQVSLQITQWALSVYLCVCFLKRESTSWLHILGSLYQCINYWYRLPQS